MIIDSKVTRLAAAASTAGERGGGDPLLLLLLLLLLQLLFREVWPKFIASSIRASRKIVHSRRNMGNIAESAEGRIPRAGEGFGETLCHCGHQL